MNKHTANHILTTMSILTLIASIPVSAGKAVAAENTAGSLHHRIGVNDLVEVKVFQEQELDTQARVSGDGTIRMPLIESVPVAGMTVDAAAREITRRLLDGYLVNPQVTVNVVTHSKRTFAVLGQVENAGTFELPDNRDITLMEAIGLAGGFNGVANRKKVTLKRRSGGSIQVFEFNAKELALHRGAQAVIVREGDVISVPESIF